MVCDLLHWSMPFNVCAFWLQPICGWYGPSFQTALMPNQPHALWSGLHTVIGLTYIGWSRWALFKFVNIFKYYIGAVNSAGQPAAIDCITLYGSLFWVLLQDASHKHLGMCISGYVIFTQEKSIMWRDKSENCFTVVGYDFHIYREGVCFVKTGIVSLFQYNPGLVP